MKGTMLFFFQIILCHEATVSESVVSERSNKTHTGFSVFFCKVQRTEEVVCSYFVAFVLAQKFTHPGHNLAAQSKLVLLVLFVYLDAHQTGRGNQRHLHDPTA